VSGETGNIQDANPAAEALTGWSLSELRAMHHSQLHPGDEAQRAREAFAEFVSAPQAARYTSPPVEWNVLHTDGGTVPVDILGEVLPGADGKPLVLGIFRDVSGRRRAEEELRASELKYRALFESMMDALAIVDMAGHIVECNPAFEAMVGYSAEELRRMKYRDPSPERWHAFEGMYMSGYPEAGEVAGFACSASNFSQKPFAREKLLRRVREILDT